MTVSLLTSPRLLAVAACCGLCCAVSVFPQTAQAAHEQAASHGPEATTLETVVVTADRLSKFAEQNPAMVEVLGRKEIQQRNMLSVDEALGTMPGVEVKQSMGVGSRISIRGSGKSGGVLVLLNGRPLNSNQYGSVDLAGIPVETIESITVFKPPVPVGWAAAPARGRSASSPRGSPAKKRQPRTRPACCGLPAVPTARLSRVPASDAPSVRGHVDGLGYRQAPRRQTHQ